MNGDARIPGPRPRQRVRVIPLQAELLPTGGVRISTPMARGWAGHARTASELVAVLANAFTEVEVASYARAQGGQYDLDRLTEHVKGDPLAGSKMSRKRGAAQRRAAHPPEAWALQDDGYWRSPGGRRFAPDTVQVQRVVAKLEARNQGIDTHGQQGVA